MNKLTKKSILAVSSLLGLTFLAGCGENEECQHVFTNYVSNNDATCAKDGTKTAKCDKCDATDTQVDTGSKKEHTFDYQPDGNATCTADGTKTAHCSVCGQDSTIPDEGSALGHSFRDYNSLGDATCTQDGTKRSICDRCDATDVKPDIGSALGHSFTDYASNHDATCTTDGTITAKCDRCDVTDTQPDVGSALGHDFLNYVFNDDATCVTDGTQTAKCDRCDATDTRVVENSKTGVHEFENYVYNNDATCTEDGTKTAKCKNCDTTDTITALGTKLGHSFTNYIANNDATCGRDGTETAKCDRCDATDTRYIENSILPHTYSTEYDYDETAHWHNATCEHTDQKGGWEQHSFTSAVTTPATCTTDGVKTYTCKCGYSYTEVIPATGHTYSQTWSYDEVAHWHYASCEHSTERADWALHDITEQVIVAPTCETDGQKLLTCSGCPFTKTEVIPATGHRFEETYTYDDDFHWYESDCGHDVISGKEAHTFNLEPDEVTPATEDAYGEERYGCTKCDYVKKVPIPNEQLRFNREVVDEEYKRSDATCEAKATYWKTDKNGIASDEYYFENGNLAAHDYEYIQEKGKNILRCKNCDFDSSEDYSEKADSELSSANISDILLNSKYAFTSTGEGEFETYNIDGNLIIREYGQRTGSSSVTNSLHYYERAIPQSNGSVYVEKGTMDWNDDYYEIDNQQCTLKSFYNFVNGTERNFAIELAMLDYVYDSNTNSYKTPYNNRDVEIRIVNKQIAGISIDSVYEQCNFTMNDSDLDDIREPLHDTNVDGSVSKIVYYQEMPTFVYHNADKNVPGSRAYIEEEFSGYISKECGDYSDVADDDLTSAQIADLVLNTRIVLREYTQLGSGTSTYYLYDNGLSMVFDNGSGDYSWELYRSLGDRVAYLEQGEMEGDTDYISSKGWYETYGHAIVPENSYLIGKQDYDPLRMATYIYSYDTDLGAYVSPDEVVRIYVQNGAISDIRVVYDNCSFRLDNGFINTLGTDFIEDFSVVKYDIVHTDSDNTYRIYKDHDYDPSYNGQRTVVSYLAVKDADCEIERVKEFFEKYIGLEFDGEYYFKYDDSSKTYTELYNIDDGFGDVTYVLSEFDEYGNYNLLLQCCKDFTSATAISKDEDEEVTTIYNFDRDPLTNDIYPVNAVITHKDVETENYVEYQMEYDFDTNDYYPVLMTGRTYDADEKSYVEIAMICDRNYTPIAKQSNTSVEYGEDDYCAMIIQLYNNDDPQNVYVEEYIRQEYNSNGSLVYFEKQTAASSDASLTGVEKHIYEYDGYDLISQQSYTWDSDLNDWVLVTE